MRPQTGRKETVKLPGFRPQVFRKVVMLVCAFALTTCVHAPSPTPAVSAAVKGGPACKLEGCCQGHGEVAYLQRDLIVMCTDGSPSLICDCHQ